MSGAAGESRPTNRNKSVNSSAAGLSASDDGRELPRPEERVSDFIDEYPDLAHLPLTQVDGQQLRRLLVEETREDHMIDVGEEHEDETAKITSVTERRPLTWAAAVEEVLGSHEDTRNTTLNLEKGRIDDHGYEAWSTGADDRWTPKYQEKYFAQMNGWLRELCGGERPSGGETVPHFDDPYVVLITRSASAAPEGENMPPVDHEMSLRNSWEPVYHTLRNTMRSDGFVLNDGWQYDRRSEPHKGERGGGINHCYGHEHIVVVVDGEVEEEDFKPVLEKHVDENNLAGSDAHRNRACVKHYSGNHWNDAVGGCEACDTAVVVKQEEDTENLPAYVADYCGIEPIDLLERDTEYIAWAAIKHATNTRTFSRSDAANHASTADSCKQRFENSQSDQDREHGEAVVRSQRRGFDFECACCGSPHEIPQDYDTLTEARCDDTSGGEAVADGGIDRKKELAQRWPKARAAASVGETPTEREKRLRIEKYLERYPEASVAQVCGALGLPESDERLVVEAKLGVDPTEVVAFERPPRWRLYSVTVREEEYPASPGGGVDMVKVDLPELRVRDEFDLDRGRRYRCECGVAAYGDTMCDHLLNVHGIDRAHSRSIISED